MGFRELVLHIILFSLAFVLSEGVSEHRGHKKKCNIFQGTWINDPRSYPLYNSSKCSFIQDQFNCQKFNRPDKLYMQFRWQPYGCNIPRFDAKDFLTRMRGKTIRFIGDSLSLNMWQSLTCMIHSSVPARYSDKRHGDVSYFKFLPDGVSLQFERNAFLVDLVNDPKLGRLMKLDSISSGSTGWKNHDVLIFNTWHWWLHKGKKQPWDHIQLGSKVEKDMDRLFAFEKALETWAKWVDANIDPLKTKVFFTGVSPVHMKGAEWGDSNAQNCGNEMKPLPGSIYPGGPHPAEEVVKKVLKSMKTHVILLDITHLSQLRKDGHPKSYGGDGHLSMDCSHWCLAGVPDTWNELFYAKLRHI